MGDGAAGAPGWWSRASCSTWPAVARHPARPGLPTRSRRGARDASRVATTPSIPGFPGPPWRRSAEAGSRLGSGLGSAEAVGRLDQPVDGARLHGGVAGVGDDVEVGFRPAPVELPGRDHRTDHVVATLDDHRRDVTDPVDAVEELIRMTEERAVDEVVALDPGDGLRELAAPETLDQGRVGAELARRSLPDAPCAGGAGADRGVGARQLPVVGGDEVVALGWRDGSEVLLPRVGKDEARAFLVAPADLLGADEADAAQDERAHPVGMGLGVGEGERRAPRAAEDDPALHAELGPDPLHVRDQLPGRVLVQARVRPALAAAALVEEHDPIGGGVEELALERLRPAAGAAVDEADGKPVGVPRLLVVDLVDSRDLEEAVVVGLGRRVELAHGDGSFTPESTPSARASARLHAPAAQRSLTARRFGKILGRSRARAPRRRAG